jgi:hypothetical protein
MKPIILCGRQGIPPHGQKDFGELSVQNEQSANEGKFRELLRFRIDAGDEDLKQHMQTCAENSTQVSWKIQNEILNTWNDLILQKIGTFCYMFLSTCR